MKMTPENPEKNQRAIHTNGQRWEEGQSFKLKKWHYEPPYTGCHKKNAPKIQMIRSDAEVTYTF